MTDNELRNIVITLMWFIILVMFLGIICAGCQESYILTNKPVASSLTVNTEPATKDRFIATDIALNSFRIVSPFPIEVKMSVPYINTPVPVHNQKEWMDWNVRNKKEGRWLEPPYCPSCR